MYRILKRRNEALREDVVRFAGELIALPSPCLGEGKVADRVEAEMTALGYDRVIRDAAGNVVGVFFGREAGPTLLFNGHMDTVPPGDTAEWSRPPFEPAVADGRLYGRGAADCKGGLAALVYAGALLRRCLLPLQGNLVVAATVAEENGRSLGVRTLLGETLPAMDLRPAHALLGEPTALGLYYGHDGWMEIEICMEGPDPFHVQDAAVAVLGLFDGDARRATGAEGVEQLSVGSARFEDGEGGRRATISLTRRLYPAEEAEGVLAEVRRHAELAVQGSGAVALQVAARTEMQRLYTGTTSLVRHVTHAWATDPFDPLLDRARGALAAAGCEVRPGRWKLGRLGMGTAGHVLVNEFKVPTVGYGPGAEEQAHAPDEYVELERLSGAVYGAAAVAHSLVGIPVFGWTSDDI